MSLREQLIELVTESESQPNGALHDDTSLIKSGWLDSLGLYNLVLWVEANTESRVDITMIDITEELDTISAILHFIERHRNPASAGA